MRVCGDRRSNTRQGFTLLEVLLALTIFVGSVAVISQLIGLGVDQAENARNQAEGLLLCENRFAELDAQLIDPESFVDETDDFFPRWTWSMAPEDLGNYLFRVTVSARHENGTQVSLSRLYFDSATAEEELSANSSSTSTGSASTASSAGGS
jgi:prepilin-type N-terminal cleavage/methylation domain-containing protein